MKPHLEITEENMAALQAFAATHNTPIVMVNLMQVRATACYEDAVNRINTRHAKYIYDTI